MEMTLSPVCWMFCAPSDSEGYHTCYFSDWSGAEPDFLAGRSHTAKILDLIMMQNGKRCREGRQQQEPRGIPSSV